MDLNKDPMYFAVEKPRTEYQRWLVWKLVQVAKLSMMYNMQKHGAQHFELPNPAPNQCYRSQLLELRMVYGMNFEMSGTQGVPPAYHVVREWYVQI